MMKKNLTTILLMLAISECLSQKMNNLWCFGDSAGISFNSLSNPIPLGTSLRTRGSCTSISDSLGNLLFYANTRATLPGNTTLVWNRENNIMLGGDSIVGRGWYKELLIIPNPCCDSLYYLFSAGVSTINGFFYSIIDMNQDSGRGAVIQKNIQLQGSTFWANDGIASLKHGNGRDWWVIVRDWSSFNNLFYFYLITQSGVVLHHTQNSGDIVQSSFYRIEPSNDGNKISCVTNKGLLSFYDFNRCSGFLSNELLIEHEAANLNLAPWYWDCEISPNNSILYVSSIYSQSDSNNYLYQYNLNDLNPTLTRDTLFKIKEPVVGGLIELAPDNKIYWSCNFDGGSIFYHDSVRNIYNENLSVINYPDSFGTACDFQPFSFYLGGKRTYYGLPNNPNYELKADSGSICDTLTVGISNNEQGISNAELFVFYHHDWQKAFINAQHLKGNKAELFVYDINGRLIFNTSENIYNGYFTYDFDMQTFSNGVYLVSLKTAKETIAKKFIKQ